MRCYVAKAGKTTLTGGWSQCMKWSMDKVKDDSSLLVKFHVVRAGEKQARVIAEISSDGMRVVDDGRYVALSRLVA